MTERKAWPRVTEPFMRTLTRNVLIALGVGSVFALRSGDSSLVLRVAVLALWFSLGGHYVEIAFLNGVRPRLTASRRAHVLARVAVWFIAGVVLFALMSFSAHLVFEHPHLGLAWWFGGVLFVLVELVVHGALLARRAPTFYDGRG